VIPRRRTLRIGSDHVIVHDERLVVVSRADMDAWQVRAKRRALITFDGRTWRVAQRTPVPPDAIRYDLVRWDPPAHEIVGFTIEYGEAYVADRDRRASADRRIGRVSRRWQLVAPLTGFLNAGIKERLETRYGLDPVATTRQSVFMEAIAILSGLALTQIGMVSRGFPSLPFLVLAVVLTPDAVIRWDRILGEDRSPPGFYEWLWNPRGRNRKR
jgi:hypothetical protein